MSEAVVDTCVLVAALIEDDVNHERARKALDELERWYIPSIVFHELVWFLRGVGLDISLSVQFLLHEKASFVKIEPDDILFSIAHSKRRPALYNDMLILSVAKKLGMRILTFDEELKELGEESFNS